MRKRIFVDRAGALLRPGAPGWRLSVLLLCVALAPILSPAEESVSVLLQKGLFAEETEGDLEAAIAIYNDIVQQTDQSRSVAAQALYRLSLCHLKLGDKEKAQASLNKLVEEYTDQESLVAMARTQLENAVVGDGEGLRVEELRWDVDGNHCEVSRDGRYVAQYFRSGSGEEKSGWCVRDLHSGAKRFLGVLEGAVPLIFSPDGSQLCGAFCREHRNEVRLIEVDSGEQRTIFSDAELGMINPKDWSPDGNSLLVHVAPPSGHPWLGLIDLKSGEMAVLTETQQPFWSAARFSPDGRRIAFSDRSADDPKRTDVFVLDLDERRRSSVAESPASDAFVAWVPRSEKLLFLSHRRAAPDLFAFDLASPDERPELVKEAVGELQPWGISEAGELFYQTVRQARDGYRVPFDPGLGKVVGKPQPIHPLKESSNTGPSFSADGRTVAYIGWGRDAENTFYLCIKSSEEAEELRWSLGFELDSSARPVFSPDGKRVLLWGKANGRSSVFGVDVGSGESELLAQADEGDRILSVDWSSTHAEIIYQCEGKDPVRRNLNSGAEKEISLERENGFRVVFSPDRTQVAFPGRNEPETICVASVETGETRVLHILPIEKNGFIPAVHAMAWSPSGKHLFFVWWRNWQKHELWRVDVDTGGAVFTGLDFDRLMDPQLHPSGKQIGFSGGGHKLQVWKMSGLTNREI